MISLTIFAVSFAAFGAALGVFKLRNYVTAKQTLNGLQLAKAIGVLILSIVISMFQPLEIQRIDAGNVGLKIDRIGNNKGIPVAREVKGWVLYNSWTTDVVEYSIRQNHVAYSAFSVTTKGGFPITVAPSFNYSLKPEKAADIYISLLKGGEFKSLEDNFLNTATVIALNNATNKYSIDSVFNNKEHFQQDVEKELNKELSKFFVVNQINPGVVAPPELANVIKAKANAVQQAQQAELDKVTAIAEAETKVAKARGDSASIVISAQAEAKAIQIKQNAITPGYTEFVKWSQWDGKLPSTMLSSGANVLLSK